MRIDLISANPDIIKSSLEFGLISRAIKKKYIEVHVHHLRDYAKGHYRQIDDEPYGGGSGMILMAEPFFRCIDKLQDERKYDEIIYLTPQGELFNQRCANILSMKENFIFICGHYKGIDQRIIDKYVTKELSIGEYVLSNGDIAAVVVIDAIARLIPGVLHDGESAITDTFQIDTVYDYPQYTRPEEIDGMKVPEVLLSGNHKKISEWREEQSLKKLKSKKNFNK
jgi:tRNA (guanine37-N1)-methyltransferase